MAQETGPGRIAFRFALWLALFLAAPLLLVAVWPVPPLTTLAWDIANILGYLSVAIAVLLFWYTGRPRATPPFSGRFFANLHRDLGYIALAALAGHIGLLLIAEPLLLEHLTPTAPAHMLAGLFSAILMLVLTLLSVTPLRRRLWQDYHRFRTVHAWLAVATVGFLLWHLYGSAYYLNRQWKTIVMLLVIAVVLYQYLDIRLVHLRHDRTVQRIRDTSSLAGRVSYSASLLVVLVAAALVWALSVE